VVHKVTIFSAVFAAAVLSLGAAAPASANHRHACKHLALCETHHHMEREHHRHHAKQHASHHARHQASHHERSHKRHQAKAQARCHHDDSCGGDVHRVAAYLVHHGYVGWDHIRMKHGVWDVDDARCADGHQRDLKLDAVTLAVLEDGHRRHH
jgi:Peptidase propeptide and YPEB domain